MSVADTSFPVAAPTPQGREAINPVDTSDRLKFPPFPQTPAGVAIMPFKDFKEGGIRMDPGPNDEEVDSYGIPTVPIPQSHASDVCKTNTKRKRRAEETKSRKKAGLSTQRSWWEQWEDIEMQRHSTGFNPLSSRFERLQAAANDFTNGRAWPLNYASETGPRFIWNKFQRYIGLPETGGIPKDSKHKATEENADDSDDDDCDEDNNSLNQSTLAGVIPDRDLAAKIAQDRAAALTEEKLSTFFDSPERSIRIFLSSYAHERGYIWSDPNLDCLPRVLLFFVNFLLRSKVFPEVERNLRRSLDVINLALFELPNTSKIGKAFPDNFSRACNACWGKMADGYKTFAPEEDLAEPIVFPEPKVATSGDFHNSWAAAEDTRNKQPDNDPWKTDGDASPWVVPGEDNPWSTSTKTDTSTVPVESWFDTEFNQQTLMTFLGPSALPLTHKTGIVERSARRIKAVIPPNPNPPKSAPQPEGVVEPDAEAVEVDLDKLFTKVVLSPMPIDWDGEECPVYSRPEILATSQGAVVEEGTPPSSEGSAGPKPHNPLEDDITLLIEADEATVKLLMEGICIGGTWVQIARQSEVAKKKKKGKSKKAIPNYWYLDEHALTVPSFWTVPTVPPGTK